MIPLTTIRGTPEEKVSLKDDHDIYNPYKTPADLDFAAKHAKAKMIYASKPNQNFLDQDLCPCCGLPLEGSKIPVTCDLSALYHLGSGYALYFQFVKHCIIMVCLMLGISGIYNLYTNYTTGDCGDVPQTSGSQYCYEDFVTKFTIANKRNHPEELSVQLVLNLITVIGIAVYFQYVRYQSRKTVIAADDETVTPADFTLQLKGVPQEGTDEELKQWLEDQGDPMHPLKVVKICKAYEISGYIKDLRLKQELTEKKNDTRANQEEVNRELNAVEERLREAKKQGLKQTDIVFAIFVQASHADFVKKKFEKSKFEKLLEIAKVLRKARDHFKGSRILLRRAPEPTDILWENLGSSVLEKLTKRLLIGLVTILLVAGGFAFVVAFSWAQILIVENSGEDSIWIEILNVLISIVVTAMDPIIGITVGKLVAHQKFSTCTGYYTAVAENLAISQFMNTALTTLFAKLVIAMQLNSTANIVMDLKLADFYGSSGVVRTAFFVFITNSFVNPIVTIFDPPFVLKQVLKRKALKDGRNNNLTQAEANDIFEGQDFGIDWRYGYMVETMLYVAFYAPVMPMALVLTLVGLVISYWTEKFVFLRNCLLPNSLSSQLQECMIEYLEWVGFMYALGNLIFYTNLQDSAGNMGIETTPKYLIYVAMIFSLIHIFFPMQLLNEKLFPLIDEVTEFVDYEDARLTFLSDYDIANPVTSRKAIKELLTSYDKKKGEETRRAGRTKMQTYYQNLLKQTNAEGGDDNQFGQLDQYSKNVMTPNDIVKRKLKKVKFTGLAGKIDRGLAEGLGNLIFNIANEVELKERGKGLSLPRISSESEDPSTLTFSQILKNKPEVKNKVSDVSLKKGVSEPSAQPGFGFFLNLLNNPSQYDLPQPSEQPPKKNSQSKKASEKSDLEIPFLGKNESSSTK